MRNGGQEQRREAYWAGARRATVNPEMWVRRCHTTWRELAMVPSGNRTPAIGAGGHVASSLEVLAF